MVISAGFAGGLSPELRTGDLVFGCRLVRVRGDDLILGPVPLVPPVGGFRPVTVVTVDEPIPKGEVVVRLPREGGASVVDMESFYVAELAASRGIPFVALRAILDPLNQEIPFPLREVQGGDGRPSLLQTLRLILRRPSIIPPLSLLWRESVIAARSLARGLDAVVGSYRSGGEGDQRGQTTRR